MNFLVRPDPQGGSRVSTETRVFATARRSPRFARYWRVIYPAVRSSAACGCARQRRAERRVFEFRVGSARGQVVTSSEIEATKDLKSEAVKPAASQLESFALLRIQPLHSR